MRRVEQLLEKISSLVFKNARDIKKYGNPKYVRGQIVSVLDDNGLEIIGKIARIEYDAMSRPHSRYIPGWDYCVEITKGLDYYGWIAEEELKPAHKKEYSVGDIFVTEDGKLVKVCREWFVKGCKECVYVSYMNVYPSPCWRFHTSCMFSCRQDRKSVYYKEIRRG